MGVLPPGTGINSELAAAAALIRTYLETLARCNAADARLMDIIERVFVDRCLAWEYRNRVRSNRDFTPARASMKMKRHNQLRALQGASRV